MPSRPAIRLAGVLQTHAVEDFIEISRPLITAAFKQLLERKHLYQSIDLISDAQILEIATKAHQKREIELASAFHGRTRNDTIAQYDYTFRATLLRPWIPNLTQDPNAALGIALGALARQSKPEFLTFTLPPTITTYCKVCKQKHPFNPILNLGKEERSEAAAGNQWFVLSYQCQGCKTDPVRFLIRRSGLKLRISGRDPFEEIETPEVLPKDQREHFSNALVAHHAGQTLAGIFLLRVFIEQFWRSLPIVADALSNEPRTSGEALGDLYNSTLPKDFKERFPSLSACYSDLSQAIHIADANVALFEKCSGAIVEHFDARRLFRI